MLPQDNETLVRTLFDAFNKRDFDLIGTLLDNDIEFVDIPNGKRHHGPEEVKQSMQNTLIGLPDGKVEITNLFVGGDWVCVEYISRGTNTGPFITPTGQLPPTGRKMEMPFCDLYQIKNGKIVVNRTYYDLATMMRQLGLTPGTTQPGR